MTERATLFDAVGTLLYAEPSPAAAYEAVGRRYGSRLALDAIARRFRAAFVAAEAFDRRDPTGRTSEERERRRWRAIVAAVLDDVADPDATFRELWDHFARPDAWRPYSDATTTLVELSRRGQTIGVASNFDARLHPIVAAHFPTIRPEHVFVSSEVGFRKPAASFFQTIAAKFAEPPRLVGDDVDNDFAGAKAAGWPAVLIDREARHAEIAPRVDDLRQLLDDAAGGAISARS